jgi:hypothetical protein
MIDTSNHQVNLRKPLGSHLIDDIGLPALNPIAQPLTPQPLGRPNRFRHSDVAGVEKDAASQVGRFHQIPIHDPNLTDS